MSWRLEALCPVSGCSLCGRGAACHRHGSNGAWPLASELARGAGDQGAGSFGRVSVFPGRLRPVAAFDSVDRAGRLLGVRGGVLVRLPAGGSALAVQSGADMEPAVSGGVLLRRVWRGANRRFWIYSGRAAPRLWCKCGLRCETQLSWSTLSMNSAFPWPSCRRPPSREYPSSGSGNRLPVNRSLTRVVLETKMGEELFAPHRVHQMNGHVVRRGI